MHTFVAYVLIILNIISLILNFITKRNLKKTEKEYIEEMKKYHREKNNNGK